MLPGSPRHCTPRGVRIAGRPIASYRFLKVRRDNGDVMHATILEESMAVAEASIPDAEVHVPDHPDAPIELRGEFDLFELRLLGEILDGPKEPGPPIRVDLSGVTFLDVRCARELVARSFPRGRRLILRDPSPQAERSLRACVKGLPGGSVTGTGNVEDGGSR